jgi:hypothetical protein
MFFFPLFERKKKRPMRMRMNIHFLLKKTQHCVPRVEIRNNWNFSLRLMRADVRRISFFFFFFVAICGLKQTQACIELWGKFLSISHNVLDFTRPHVLYGPLG